MTNSPSGICVDENEKYKEYEDVIEYIANVKAIQYRSISYLDVADLKQEARIKCWQIISDNRYDPERSNAKLKTYLNICVDNRIRDIRRSILYKYDKPCFRCPFYNKKANKAGLHYCEKFANKDDCKPYLDHYKYVQCKLSISSPMNIDGQRIEDSHGNSYVRLFDLIEFINEKLPGNLRDSFKKVSDSNFQFSCIKGKEKVKLIKALRKILEKYKE